MQPDHFLLLIGTATFPFFEGVVVPSQVLVSATSTLVMLVEVNSAALERIVGIYPRLSAVELDSVLEVQLDLGRVVVSPHAR